MNLELDIIDITRKESAEHSIDFITAVTDEKYSVYCGEVYTSFGIFLVIKT